MMIEEELRGVNGALLMPTDLRAEQEKLHIQIKKMKNQIAMESNEFYGRTVLIKLREGLAKVRVSQIEYVSYSNHTLLFHMVDGRVIKSRVIQESFAAVAENTLTDERLIRPHESYLVNMDHVASISSRAFEMHSGAEVPISKRVYTQIKRAFVDYVMNRYQTDIL